MYWSKQKKEQLQEKISTNGIGLKIEPPKSLRNTMRVGDNKVGVFEGLMGFLDVPNKVIGEV